MTSPWTEERIDAVVTRTYITSRLPAKGQGLLHRPLSFGDSLTDDTYLDWIVEKCKRLFLIFDDLGIPEWIFEAVDRSYQDDDLPLDEQAIWDLNLSHGKTNSLDKLFFRRQHKYLIKVLREGEHVEYTPTDIVPVEPIAKKSGRLNGSDIDQVRFGGVVYKRRAFALGEDDNLNPKQFVLHIKALQRLRHPHMISIFASYSQGDLGHVLLAPATDVTLKSFLEDPPKCYKQLSKAERRGTLLRWMHRLSHAVAYLHEQGYAHQAIRPSNIFISPQNRIFLGEPAALDILQGRDDGGREMYEHSSPEQWQRKPVLQEVESDKLAQPAGGRTARRIRHGASSSSFSPKRPSSAVSDNTVRDSGSWHRSSRRSSGSGNRTSYTPTIASMHAPSLAPTTSSSASSPSDSSGSTVKKRTIITTFTPSLLPSLLPSDIFSLCAVHIHLLSAIFSHASDSHFASKFSTKSLRSHISKRNRSAGRGGAPADSSFHANLHQVNSWIEKIEQEAEAKRKKDKDNGTWEAVGGLAWVVRSGLRKNATERAEASDLVKHIRGFIGIWGESRPTSREEMRSMGDEVILEEEEEQTELPSELSAVRSAETDISDNVTIQLDRYESSSSNGTREDDTWSAPEEGGSSSLSEDFTPVEAKLPAPWPLPARKTTAPIANYRPLAKPPSGKLRTDRELLTDFFRD